MPTKLGGDNHSQSVNNCYVMNNLNIRRRIQVIWALRSVIVDGGGALLRFHIITVK